jgi:hypothetical protein
MGSKTLSNGLTRMPWSKARRAAFLDRLAETCNVQLASAAAGVRKEAVYALRRRDSEFEAAWKEALAQGYDVLETRLVGHALNGPDPDEPLDVELAIRLLTRHGNALAGRVPRTGSPPRRATREETDAAILKKIEMIERARKQSA